MKRVISLFFLFSLLVLSCREVAPLIPSLSDVDSNPSNTEVKNILMEEFTGVRCSGCPSGSAEIENLIDIHGDRIIPVSIHAGYFAVPYADQEDYSTQEGEAILALLGGSGSYPAGVINRTLFEGELDYQLSFQSWPGYIDNELKSILELDFEISSNFDSQDRSLNIDIEGKMLSNIDAPLNITVLITESKLISQQNFVSGVQDDYEHKHVLRSVLSNPVGDLFAENGLASGQNFNKSFQYTLPDHWVSEHCKVVAFIHESGVSRKVHQVKQISLQE